MSLEIELLPALSKVHNIRLTSRFSCVIIGAHCLRVFDYIGDVKFPEWGSSLRWTASRWSRRPGNHYPTWRLTEVEGEWLFVWLCGCIGHKQKRHSQWRHLIELVKLKTIQRSLGQATTSDPASGECRRDGASGFVLITEDYRVFTCWDTSENRYNCTTSSRDHLKCRYVVTYTYCSRILLVQQRELLLALAAGSAS